MHTNTVACLGCGFCNDVADYASASPRCVRCRRWLPWIAVAGDGDFDDVIANCPVPVLVEMGGRGLNHKFSPAAVQLAIERAGALKLVKVDVDKTPELVEQFTIRIVPTLLLFDHGRLLARHSGLISVSTLRRWLDQSVGAPAAFTTL